MDRTACGHANRSGARFCSTCGARLGIVCSSCSRLLDPTATFCDQCGAPARPGTEPAAAATDDAVRKVVTVLFADLVGSTAFEEQVETESSRDALAEFHALARSVIDEHEGRLAKFTGDGVMAVFGVPDTSEDDATRAVETGLALQRGFSQLRRRIAERHGRELGLRIGINTGEVVVASDDDDMVGDTLNTASRLEAACAPGQVLVGEETWRSTRSVFDFDALGSLDMRGKAVPVATYQVIASARTVDERSTPFVGRKDELARLRTVFDRAVDVRSARLATVVAAPGLGKTRLAEEFRRTVADETTVVEMRCRRSGMSTFAPVAEFLRSAMRVDAAAPRDDVVAAIRRLVRHLDDADRIAGLLASFVGAGPDLTTEEAFLAVRRLVESQATEAPILVVVDDVQWAETLFLDLLDHLVEWVRDAPVMILALARPELRAIRPSLAAGGRHVEVAIALEGLAPATTAELAAKLVGATELPAELVDRLVRSTDGNPLFVREFVRMLVDDGIVVDRDGSWELTIAVDAIEVPPTIQALLSARLDRMEAGERRLLELAAVVGSEFPLGAVEALAAAGQPQWGATMERLRARELVEPTGRRWGDEPVLRFHHVLIRDTAYRRLLKRRRAELHLRVADWLAATAAGLTGEHEVMIAGHLEQAYAYRRELSDTGAETVEIGRRAARLLAVACRRAVRRDNATAAGVLAERAIACLDAGNPLLPDLVVLGCESFLGLGDAARAADLVDRLWSFHGDGRIEAWGICFRAQRAVLTEPGAIHAAVRDLEEAADDFATLGDAAGVAKAHLVRAEALTRLGRIGESEPELDRALVAARAGDDRRRVAAILGVAPVAALWGPSPIPRAGGRCLDVIRLLRISAGSSSVEAVSMRCQAVLEALRGRYATARALLTDARAIVEELGLRHQALEVDLYEGIVELLAGRPGAAEPALRRSYSGLIELGADTDAGHAAAYLARALLRNGRIEEADDIAAASDALAGQMPQTGILARAVQAEIFHAMGRLQDALELAREAVEIASATDLVVDHADASAVLSSVAIDDDEAAAARDAAVLLYRTKAADVPSALMREPSDDDSENGDRRHRSRRTSRVLHEAGSRARPLGGASEAVTDPAFECLAWRLSVRVEALMNSRTIGEHVDDLYESDFERIDRRRIVGTGVIDMETYVRTVPQFFREIVHTPIARRGERLLLSRARIRYEGDNESALLVMSEVAESGRERRTWLFDEVSLDDAIRELDRGWRATLSTVERAVVERLRDFGRAFARQDGEEFDRLLHPAFRAVEHGALGGGVMDRATWQATHRDQDDVFGRRRVVPDVVELISPDVAVVRHASSGRNAADLDWELMEWSVFRFVDGLIGGVEVFDAHPLDLQLAAVRRRARELVADGAASTP